MKIDKHIKHKGRSLEHKKSVYESMFNDNLYDDIKFKKKNYKDIKHKGVGRNV